MATTDTMSLFGNAEFSNRIRMVALTMAGDVVRNQASPEAQRLLVLRILGKLDSYMPTMVAAVLADANVQAKVAAAVAGVPQGTMTDPEWYGAKVLAGASGPTDTELKAALAAQLQTLAAAGV